MSGRIDHLWRQLRWRIIGSHLFIVMIGVAILLLTMQILIAYAVPTRIQPRLVTLTEVQGEQAVAPAMTELLTTFRNTVLTSLLFAALGALGAGLVASLLLTRGILQPLNEIAHSSRRIADGHYDERITMPNSHELALVATNFNQMAEALEQIEQKRLALIGNVSHELRTPLSGIEGYLEGLMDGLFPDNAETFAHMYQEVRRLRRLVNDLRDLSSVEAGQISLHLETFDVLAVVRRVVDQLRPQTISQELEIITICSGSEMMIHADPDRTTQILLNLIGNAIRYTFIGGHITIRCTTTQTMAKITIQDSGIGIPADALPYIFERFYRVDSSRARASGGSGIGLTIARHLAWAMQGELSASSEGEGQGSIFSLLLPLADT